MTIVVFGSVNMDLVARTPRLPEPGETISGREFHTTAGGKGANQAVAAARLGAPTQFIGRVGDDVFGEQLRRGLQEAGVDTAALFIDAAVASGVALIAVDDQGQNNIIVVAGANGRIDNSDLARLEGLLPQAQLLMLQLEIPLPMVRAAAEMARAYQVRVMLDPAPAQPLPAEILALADIVTPNEIEARQLAGFPVATAAAAQAAGRWLTERGVQTAIVKMGAAGVYYATAGGLSGHAPAFPVPVVDTVAAGDAFNGGLAAALLAGEALPEAVRWGAAAGALTVTRRGAQAAMPTRREVAELLAASP